MAELGDFLVSGDSSVHIEVDMLDYGYVNKCTDEKILRGIIETLKSGKEGIYPELCQAAEDKLLSVLPEKERRKIQRLKHQTTPSQIIDAKNDLDCWQNEVFETDKELRSKDTAHQSRRKLPPVRGQKIEKLDVLEATQKSFPKGSDAISKSNPSQRLSGYDFPAWEKFNVEEALAEIDNEEINEQKEAQSIRLKKRQQAEEALRNRMEKHSKALEALRADMKISELSHVQRKSRAAREKQKGNEAFRAGENEEAYTYYSRSLALDDTVAAVYSNRALVCLRTGKLETAEDDCSRALFLDPKFTKAKSRRGIARLKSGKYELAILDFESVLEVDSANRELVSLLQKAKDKYLEVEGKEFVSDKEKQRRKQALDQAILDGLTIEVASTTTPETLLHPVVNESVELLYSGICDIVRNSTEHLTRIIIDENSDSDGNDEDKHSDVPNRIPIEECSDTDDDDDDDDDDENGSEKLDGFTRIQIDDDSDSDEEVDECQEHTTRIVIEEGSDSEEEGSSDKSRGSQCGRDSTLSAEVHNSSCGFVRINVTDNTDSDSDSDSNIAGGEGKTDNAFEKSRKAENLKKEANEAMQRGDIEKAIQLYCDCVAVDASSPIAIAAYGNRSLAYLKLKQYTKVLEDVNRVLTHDPLNLKALYRRSLAHEGTGSLDDALRDVDEILRIQPENELALEARNRFASSLKASPSVSYEKSKVSDVVATTGQESDARIDKVAKSVELKVLGNDALKAGNYNQAIDFYSDAIAFDPTNLLFYNNRAQAYIKTSQFKMAEVDASHVIERSVADIPNLKAFYRRALARKGLDTVESLKKALDDISFILSHEPHNKAANAEKLSIGKQLKNRIVSQDRERSKAVEHHLNASKTSGVVGMTERSSKLKRVISSEQEIKSETSASSAKESLSSFGLSSGSQAELSSPKRNDISTITSHASHSIASKYSVANPVVPTNPPKTVYEFERIWRGLKNHPHLFASYLACFKKSTFKKVIKETCSPDLISSMLVAVRDHMLVSEGGRISDGMLVLEGLSGIPTYDIVRMVLPNGDLECIKSCLDFVSVHVDAEKATDLRRKLKI